MCGVEFQCWPLPFQSSFSSPCDHCPPPPCSLSLSPHPPGTCWNKTEPQLAQVAVYDMLTSVEIVKHAATWLLMRIFLRITALTFFATSCHLDMPLKYRYLFSQEAVSMSMLWDRDRLWDCVSRLLEGELERELTPSLLWLPYATPVKAKTHRYFNGRLV